MGQPQIILRIPAHAHDGKRHRIPNRRDGIAAGGCAHIPDIRFVFALYLEIDIGLPCQHGIIPLAYADDRRALCLAAGNVIQNFRSVAALGKQHRHIALLDHAHTAMNGIPRRAEGCGNLYHAQRMRDALRKRARCAAARSDHLMPLRFHAQQTIDHLRHHIAIQRSLHGDDVVDFDVQNAVNGRIISAHSLIPRAFSDRPRRGERQPPFHPAAARDDRISICPKPRPPHRNPP